MSDSSKCEQARKWLQVFVPVLVVVIAGVFSVIVADGIQRRAQERSNDIAIAGLVVDVLNEENPAMFIWLSDLVKTIKDDTLQNVMAKAVLRNDSVPDSIKIDISEKIPSVTYTASKIDTQVIEGGAKADEVSTTGKEEDFVSAADDPNCRIFYHGRDLRPINQLINTLQNNGFQRIESELKPYRWFKIYDIGVTDKGQIWYRQSGSIYAIEMSLYAKDIMNILNAENIWREFQIKLTHEARVYGKDIYIILPPEDTLEY